MTFNSKQFQTNPFRCCESSILIKVLKKLSLRLKNPLTSGYILKNTRNIFTVTYWLTDCLHGAQTSRWLRRCYIYLRWTLSTSLRLLLDSLVTFKPFIYVLFRFYWFPNKILVVFSRESGLARLTAFVLFWVKKFHDFFDDVSQYSMTLSHPLLCQNT